MDESENVTQEQLNTIVHVATRLAPKYVFGPYDRQDIIQEGCIFGLEAMSRYNPDRPLENFLFVHIGNRLKSFKRDNYARPAPTNLTDEQLEKWDQKYQSKKNLVEPITLESIADEEESNMYSVVDFLDEIQVKDIFEIIDINLGVEFRVDFLKMKQGVKSVPKPRRDKIYQIIIEILAENGYETW